MKQEYNIDFFVLYSYQKNSKIFMSFKVSLLDVENYSNILSDNRKKIIEIKLMENSSHKFL